MLNPPRLRKELLEFAIAASANDAFVVDENAGYAGRAGVYREDYIRGHGLAMYLQPGSHISQNLGVLGLIEYLMKKPRIELQRLICGPDGVVQCLAARTIA